MRIGVGVGMIGRVAHDGECRPRPTALCDTPLEMRLQPNPPRLVTVVVALVLGVIGLVVLLPIEPLLPLIEPINDILGAVGLSLDRELASLALFACPTLLVVGALLPGI